MMYQGLRELVESSTVQYKCHLAFAGVVDGSACSSSVAERLYALKEYQLAWRTLSLPLNPASSSTRRPEPRTYPFRVLTFSGPLVAMHVRSKLRLYRRHLQGVTQGPLPFYASRRAVAQEGDASPSSMESVLLLEDGLALLVRLVFPRLLTHPAYQREQVLEDGSEMRTIIYYVIWPSPNCRFHARAAGRPSDLFISTALIFGALMGTSSSEICSTRDP